MGYTIMLSAQIRDLIQTSDSDLMILEFKDSIKELDGDDVLELQRVIIENQWDIRPEYYKQLIFICADRLSTIQEMQFCIFDSPELPLDLDKQDYADVISFEEASLLTSLEKALKDPDENIKFSCDTISPKDIKNMRKAMNLSQDSFAKLLGFSVGTIRHWEQGLRKPSKKSLHRLLNH